MSDGWDLVGGDPAPGDAALVRLLAKEIGQTADSAHHARLQIDAIHLDASTCGWEGHAAVSFTEKFGPLGPDLGLMAQSYDRVAIAVATYADQLAGIQESAQHALTRARLARQRIDAAGPRRDAAARLVGDLRRQLVVVKTDESAKAIQLAATTVLDPNGAMAEHQALEQTRATRHAVERSLYRAEADEATAQHEVDDASGELAAARAWADSLRDEHHAAETRAAGSIHSALEQTLRNTSNFSRVAGWATRQVKAAGHGVTDFVGDVASGDFVAAVARIRRVLDEIGKVLVIALVAVAIVGLFVGGLAFGPLLLVGAAVVAGLKLAADAYLLGRKDKQGRGYVHGGELAWDILGAAAAAIGVSEIRAAEEGTTSLFGGLLTKEAGAPSGLEIIGHPTEFLREDSSSLSYIERSVWPDARYATGIFHTYVPVAGEALPESAYAARAAYGTATAVKAADDYHDVTEVRDTGIDLVHKVRGRYGVGVAQPAVGACYAN